MAKIMYLCEVCDSEYCGRDDPDDLRLLPDGRQICQECFDDEPPIYPEGVDIEQDPEPIRWSALKPIQIYVPATTKE